MRTHTQTAAKCHWGLNCSTAAYINDLINCQHSRALIPSGVSSHTNTHTHTVQHQRTICLNHSKTNIVENMLCTQWQNALHTAYKYTKAGEGEKDFCFFEISEVYVSVFCENIFIPDSWKLPTKEDGGEAARLIVAAARRKQREGICHCCCERCHERRREKQWDR